MKYGLIILCLAIGFQAEADTQPKRRTIGDFFGDLFGGGNNNRNEGGEVTVAEEDYVASDKVSIVIDRNPKVQQMKVYMEGQTTPWKVFPISTGRETFDIPTNFKRNPECSTTPMNDPKNPYGLTRMHELNRSDTWLHKDETTGKMVGSDMPHSMFFVGGVAMHAATGPGLDTLGPKDGDRGQAMGGSGGCVRMKPCDVETVFNLFAGTHTMTEEERRAPPVEAGDKCADVSLPAGKAYSRINQSLEPHCRAKTTPRCTDPAQWPIKTNGRKAEIRVVDTRPPEEVKKVAERCQNDSNKFNKYKSACLLDKVIENVKATGGTYDSAKVTSDATYRGQFLSDSLKGLTAKQRSDFNSECNRKVYYDKVIAKCQIAEIEKLPGNKRTIDPNQGMYEMSEVDAWRKKQKPADFAKVEQFCAQKIASEMYISPSDPEPRPTGIPIPQPSPARDANGRIIRTQ